MKHKMRKFEMGGPTSYAESGGGGGSDMTFSQAFKAARAVAKREGRDPDKEPFTWKGKKYKAEMGGSKASAPARVTETKTTTEVETPASSGARSGGRGSKPGSARVGTGRYDDPTSSYGERVFSPLKKLGDIFGLRKEERVMRDMGVGREEARRRLEAKEESGMYRGGSIKKMARGGVAHSSASRRADGIAKKGKTRGRII